MFDLAEIDKEENFYQLLKLDNVFVEKKTIKEAYSKIKQEYQDDLDYLQRATVAVECLTQMKCRDQYTRFANTLQIDDKALGIEQEFDWKMAFSVCFYVLFAFTHAALAKVEQKPGLRFGMGVGIMFCANEISILQSAAAQIKDGQKPDPAIEAITGLFPPYYATFEIIILLRLVFFVIFSITNAVSLTYC